MARACRAIAFPLSPAPFKSCIFTNLDWLLWDRVSKLWRGQQWCYSGTWKALDRTSEVGSGLESSTHSTSMSLSILTCIMSRWVLLKLACATESTRELVKMHTLGLTPRFSRAGVGSLRRCLSDKVPGDAEATGPCTALWEPLDWWFLWPPSALTLGDYFLLQYPIWSFRMHGLWYVHLGKCYQ